MKLVKGNYVMITEDETVIRAFKLNGFTEVKAGEVPASISKEEKPKKTTKK